MARTFHTKSFVRGPAAMQDPIGPGGDVEIDSMMTGRTPVLSPFDPDFTTDAYSNIENRRNTTCFRSNGDPFPSHDPIH